MKYLLILLLVACNPMKTITGKKSSGGSGDFYPRGGGGNTPNQGSFANGILQINTTNAHSASQSDEIKKVLIDQNGFAYLIGETSSSLGGVNAGNRDIFIAKIETSTGQLDLTFGDGDGFNDDGILQINMKNSADADQDQFVVDAVFDSSNDILIAGYTFDNFGGATGGGEDIFVLKVHSNSGLLNTAFGNGDGVNNDGITLINTTVNAGVTGSEYPSSIVLDNTGSLYISAHSTGTIGGVNAGGNDVFIIKLDSTTGAIDTAFGDGDGTDNDGIVQINGVNTTDASSSEQAKSITIDSSGDLYLLATTQGIVSNSSGGSQDNFIIKLDSISGSFDPSFGDGDGADNDGILQFNGNKVPNANMWDNSYDIEIDSLNNIYVLATANAAIGGTHAGSNDILIYKLDNINGSFITAFGNSDGTDNDGILQINETNSEYANSSESPHEFIFDGSGSLYVGGYTSGYLGGINAGGSDGFIVKLNKDSGELDPNFGDGDGFDNDGILQLNNKNSDDAGANDDFYSIALDNNGSLYLAGKTNGQLGGKNAGNDDAVLVKTETTDGLLDTNFGAGD